MANRRDD